MSEQDEKFAAYDRKTRRNTMHEIAIQDLGLKLQRQLSTEKREKEKERDIAKDIGFAHRNDPSL